MKKSKNTIKKIDWTFLSSKDMGLLLIRIFIGIIMFKAGLGKLMHPEMGLGFFQKLGLNDAFFWGTAFAEALGGIAIFFGYRTRAAAALITGVVLGIILLTFKMPGEEHLPYTISLMTNTLALFIMGGGAWGIDGWCARSGKCACDECVQPDSCCGCGTCELPEKNEVANTPAEESKSEIA